jgi:glycerophosphoryl diester phosphodiesterase
MNFRHAKDNHILRNAATSLIALAAIAAPLATLAAHPKAPDTGATRKAEIERRLASPDGHVMVVSHRGCWKLASENSLDGIRACIAAGIDMVELDVRATRDGKLVLMHDATVDRMTDGHGKVSDLDWADLQKLHLRQGGGKDSPLTDRTIPTFEDALRVAKDKILINVDAKTLLPESTLDMIDRLSDRRQILFKAEAPLAMIQKVAPWVSKVPFQVILREPYLAKDPAGIIASYDAVHPVGYEIDVKHQDFAPQVTPAIRQRCARYWVDTLSGRAFEDAVAIKQPDQVWGKMIALGVDAMQTDEPVALKAYLKRSGAKSLRCTR